MATGVSDVVPDPVSHISISGVHGQEEVDERIAHATPQMATFPIGGGRTRARSVETLLLGVAIGAVLMYAFNSKR